MAHSPTTQHADPNPQPARPKRRGRFIAYGVLALVLLLLVSVVGAVVWASSQAGQARLIAWATQAAEEVGYGLDIRGVEGSIFRDLSIENIALEVNSEVIFQAENIRFAWQPSALWSWVVQVEALTADAITLKLPAGGASRMSH
ncbi:MAG: hypothetical protein AAF213_07475 [Pseudomonadota bacterium]